MTHEHLTSEELLALAAHRAWLPKRFIRTIAEHPAANADVWLELLKGGGVFEEYIIAEQEAARAAARVRDRLRRSEHPRVLARLCEDATRPELHGLFPRLVDLNPDVALVLLDSHPTLAQRLTPESLVPLLDHHDSSVRKRVLPYLALADGEQDSSASEQPH